MWQTWSAISTLNIHSTNEDSSGKTKSSHYSSILRAWHKTDKLSIEHFGHSTEGLLCKPDISNNLVSELVFIRKDMLDTVFKPEHHGDRSGTKFKG